MTSLTVSFLAVRLTVHLTVTDWPALTSRTGRGLGLARGSASWLSALRVTLPAFTSSWIANPSARASGCVTSQATTQAGSRRERGMGQAPGWVVWRDAFLGSSSAVG